MTFAEWYAVAGLVYALYARFLAFRLCKFIVRTAGPGIPDDTKTRMMLTGRQGQEEWQRAEQESLGSFLKLVTLSAIGWPLWTMLTLRGVFKWLMS